jgi:hypothetical protein
MVWPVRKFRKFTLADRAKTEIASLRYVAMWQKLRRNAMGMTVAGRAAPRNSERCLDHRLADFRQRLH